MDLISTGKWDRDLKKSSHQKHSSLSNSLNGTSGREERKPEKRAERQKEIDAGKLPDFLKETEHIRSSDWTIASLPKDLEDRRVDHRTG